MSDMQQYSLNFSDPASDGVKACDWNWIEKGKWVMSSREKEIRWQYEGPLTEEGRQKLLEYFGLENAAEQLPLEKIEKMAPAALMQLRRDLEAREGLPKISRMSDRIGGHIPAELVAA
ncbi:MAG TPA: hypothetical protein VMV71_00165 [Candidatus Paceibacterota bacterium]|nr:hypothetical protein [Candidatus Paceibacterota bacterium]